MVTDIERETAAEFARMRSRAERRQPPYSSLKGFQDGGTELPISVGEIGHALDYALMLICQRRGDLRKTVS